MDLELVPDAAPLERLAVARAVAVAALEAPGRPSRWWAAGLSESLDREPEVPPRAAAYEAARSPRSRRGATRA